jgi:hypothetical protein
MWPTLTETMRCHVAIYLRFALAAGFLTSVSDISFSACADPGAFVSNGIRRKAPSTPENVPFNAAASSIERPALRTTPRT